MINIATLLIITTFYSPLGLDWGKEHTKPPKVEGYRYYTGSIKSGSLTYLNKTLLLSMETEVQLYFSNNKLSKALLIFGPRGITDSNCLARYNLVLKFLTKKYGPPQHRVHRDASIINELIYSSKCHAIKTGIKEARAYWANGANGLTNTAALLGDYEGIYIEILYTSIKNIKKFNKEQKKQILKKLSREI